MLYVCECALSPDHNGDSLKQRPLLFIVEGLEYIQENLNSKISYFEASIRKYYKSNWKIIYLCNINVWKNIDTSKSSKDLKNELKDNGFGTYLRLLPFDEKQLDEYFSFSGNAQITLKRFDELGFSIPEIRRPFTAHFLREFYPKVEKEVEELKVIKHRSSSFLQNILQCKEKI